MDPHHKILIVDDAAMFRELGALFLARTARVLTANNGFEGLDVARRARPHVVVADLDMPCMGGEELCRRIKADSDLRDTPVILVTTDDRGEERARAVRAGADDVIEKPISRIALIQAVNRFLRGPRVRGLARVPIEAPVRIVAPPEDVWGVARNLSRGGIFVEAASPIPPATEVALEFQLPESPHAIAPTAQVIWRREHAADSPDGMGLQFLALDRESAASIDAFVYERAPGPAENGTVLSAAGSGR
jgi:uncharacterized protein (TIGR02266 family)